MDERAQQETIAAAPCSGEGPFRALIQQSCDLISVLDRDGLCTYVSPSIERLLGYPADAVLGESALNLIHAEDADVFQAAFTACLAGASQSAPVEVRFRRRDGGWITCETIGINLLDDPAVHGVAFHARDMSARIEAESALRASEARFRSAFDHAPIGLAIVAPDGQFREVNHSLSALVGFDEGELLTMICADLTHGEDLIDSQERDARLWRGEIDRFAHAMRYVHKRGDVIWVNRTVSAVTDSDGNRAAILQIEDIGARHQLDLERATMLASERAYARQARELAEMRADLTRMISHELQAPVAAVRMMMSALETGELAQAGQQEMHHALQTQIDQLDRLVADVAAVSTAEREDFSVQLHDVPLSVLLDGAQAFASGAMKGSPVSIADGERLHVWCDPDRISQVLRNLLDNVLRHTPPGTAAAIRVTRTGGMARIEVADDGPGVSADDQPIIFEKFARGRAASDSQRHGAGLGLYVSRQIVRAHGADLTYADRPGGGAVFGFDLRIVR